MDLPSAIFVVDNDVAVGRTMKSVGQLLEIPVRVFRSADAFLARSFPSQSGCLVLEVRLPGMSGLELQRRLVDESSALPIIMVSDRVDVPIAVEAMRHGAVTVLEKPFSLNEIAIQIREAMRIEGEQRALREEQAKTASRLARLTIKEREVLALIGNGRTNKEMAAVLNLSVRAIEDRRSRVMKKLAVRSLVELHRFVSA